MRVKRALNRVVGIIRIFKLFPTGGGLVPTACVFTKGRGTPNLFERQRRILPEKIVHIKPISCLIDSESRRWGGHFHKSSSSFNPPALLRISKAAAVVAFNCSLVDG